MCNAKEAREWALLAVRRPPSYNYLLVGKVPLLIMADSKSPELVSFNKCSDLLRRGVHPDDLVSKLFAVGILSAADKSEASNYMLTNSRRAQIMFDAIASKVSNSPQTFHDLVQILRSEDAYAAIAQKLQGQSLRGPSEKKAVVKRLAVNLSKIRYARREFVERGS